MASQFFKVSRAGFSALEKRLTVLLAALFLMSAGSVVSAQTKYPFPLKAEVFFGESKVIRAMSSLLGKPDGDSKNIYEGDLIFSDGMMLISGDGLQIAMHPGAAMKARKFLLEESTAYFLPLYGYFSFKVTENNQPLSVLAPNILIKAVNAEFNLMIDSKGDIMIVVVSGFIEAGDPNDLSEVSSGNMHLFLSNSQHLVESSELLEKTAPGMLHVYSSRAEPIKAAPVKILAGKEDVADKPELKLSEVQEKLEKEVDRRAKYIHLWNDVSEIYSRKGRDARRAAIEYQMLGRNLP